MIPTVKKIQKEAIEGGADIIITTGFDDGGTIPENPISTFSIVHMIVDAAEDKRVPVMVAGVSLMKKKKLTLTLPCICIRDRGFILQVRHLLSSLQDNIKMAIKAECL